MRFGPMRRAVQIAMLAWVLAWGGVWGQEARSGRSNLGGEVRGTQHVGVPWNAISARIWGRRGPAPFEEWTLGMSHQGWSAWTQSDVVSGGRFQSGEQAWFEGTISAGLVRWPEVRARSGLLRAEVAGTHERPWGLFRCHAFTEAGQGQTWWRENPNPNVVLGGNRWGWEMMWAPQFDGVPWPLPALSWASDGSWTLAWSSSHDAWANQRLWRPPPGSIQLAWTFPESRVELAWRCSLRPRGSGVGRASTQGPEDEGPRRAHFMRVGTSAQRVSSTWQWAWEWCPSESQEQF